LEDAREQFPLAVFLRRIADRALVFVQLLIEQQRVVPLERPELSLRRSRDGGNDVHGQASVFSLDGRRGRKGRFMKAGTSSPNPCTASSRCSRGASGRRSPRSRRGAGFVG